MHSLNMLSDMLVMFALVLSMVMSCERGGLLHS